MKLAKDECPALDRPIYGTRQGGRIFSDALDEHLRTIGFVQNTADPCAWMRMRKEKLTSQRFNRRGSSAVQGEIPADSPTQR